MSEWTRRALLSTTAILAAERALAAVGMGVAVPGVNTTQTITTVMPASGSVAHGAGGNTVVAAVSVTMSPVSPAFAGTLSLTGADAASFNLSSTTLPSNLRTTGALADGTYHVNVVATQVGANGSPFSQPCIVSVGATTLATLTLVNTSGSTQAANFISPIFGWAFKKGDIATGTAPQFQVSGVNQSFSWGCQSYWSDGSLRWASFMLRCASSIAGNGTLAVSILNNGALPTTSARTLTEVHNQLIQVNCAGLGNTTNYGSISGTLSAFVNGDANEKEQYVYLDGDAGKVWRIRNDFTASAGGAAHGQLVCYNYIAALTNSGGNLGGFRFLYRITQPFWNNDTPTKNWRAFSTVNFQYGAGPTTIALNFPFTAQNFTVVGGSTLQTTSNNNYYQGAATGYSGQNMVPGYLTTTGSLPGGLNTGQIYWWNTNTSTPLTLGYVEPFAHGGGTGIAPSNSGTGTHTFNPVPVCLHFGSIWSGDINAKWTFFQGTGSLAADHTVRTQFDQTYLHSTGLLAQPYDLSKTGGSNPGQINDNVFSYNWTPYSTGPYAAQTRHLTGSAIMIGLIQGYCVRQFYNQSAVSELVVRALGYCQDLDCNGSFRDVASGQYANFGNTGYSPGVPTPSAAQQGLNVAGSFALDGFNGPTNGTWFCTDDQDLSHKPSFAYYAALIFGEPQFLDLTLEALNSAILESGQIYRNIPNGSVVGVPAGYGIVSNGESGDVRPSAWANRDVQFAATLAPATHPDGTKICDYIRGMADASANYPNSVMGAAYVGTYFNSIGAWAPVYGAANPGPIRLDYFASGFQLYYFILVMAVAAQRENSAAKTFLQNEVGGALKHWAGLSTNPYHLYSECWHSVLADTDGNSGLPITDDTQWGCALSDPTSWDANGVFTPTFGVTTTISAADKWIFDAGSAHNPANFTADVGYFAVNVTGTTFKLSATNGGSAISTGSSGSNANDGPLLACAGPWGVLANPPAAATGSSPDGSIGGSNYLAQAKAAWSAANAAGVTGIGAMLTDAETRQAALASTIFDTDPTWCCQRTL